MTAARPNRANAEAVVVAAGLTAALQRSVVQVQVPVMAASQLLASDARPQPFTVVTPPLRQF